MRILNEEWSEDQIVVAMFKMCSSLFSAIEVIKLKNLQDEYEAVFDNIDEHLRDITILSYVRVFLEESKEAVKECENQTVIRFTGRIKNPSEEILQEIKGIKSQKKSENMEYNKEIVGSFFD